MIFGSEGDRSRLCLFHDVVDRPRQAFVAHEVEV